MRDTLSLALYPTPGPGKNYTNLAIDAASSATASAMVAAAAANNAANTGGGDIRNYFAPVCPVATPEPVSLHIPGAQYSY